LVDWTCATDKERLIFLDLPSLSLSPKKGKKSKLFLNIRERDEMKTVVSSLGLVEGAGECPV
jgi:hypothetical protein